MAADQGSESPASDGAGIPRGPPEPTPFRPNAALGGAGREPGNRDRKGQPNPDAGLGERPSVVGDRLVGRGVGRQVLVLALELAVEPAREIADRLDDGVLGVVRHGLPGGAVAFDLDRHAVLVVVLAGLPDERAELVEVALLRLLKLVGDRVQCFVGRGVAANGAGTVRGIKVGPVERGAVALVGETPKPDVRRLARAAAHLPDGVRPQRHAKQAADGLEVIENGVVPLVVEAGNPIPGAGPFPGGSGQFRQLVDHGFDDAGHSGLHG